MISVPGIGGAAHVVLAPAFVDEKPAFYTLTLDMDTKQKQHHRTSVEKMVDGPPRHARVATAGSGAQFVKHSHTAQLARLVGRHEKKGKVSAFSVAREFAKVIVPWAEA